MVKLKQTTGKPRPPTIFKNCPKTGNPKLSRHGSITYCIFFEIFENLGFWRKLYRTFSFFYLIVFGKSESHFKEPFFDVFWCLFAFCFIFLVLVIFSKNYQFSTKNDMTLGHLNRCNSKRFREFLPKFCVKTWNWTWFRSILTVFRPRYGSNIIPSFFASHFFFFFDALMRGATLEYTSCPCDDRGTLCGVHVLPPRWKRQATHVARLRTVLPQFERLPVLNIILSF